MNERGVVWLGSPSFPDAARAALGDAQLRANLKRATTTIRDKRLAVASELDDWEALCESAAAIKKRTSRHLDRYLVQLEESVTAAGGTVHWASATALNVIRLDAYWTGDDQHHTRSSRLEHLAYRLTA